MKFVLIFSILLILSIGCVTNPAGARRVLEIEGFTDIEITGYSFFACGRDDYRCTGFKAKKNGIIVTGAVSQGIGPCSKNNTIRYD